MQQMVSTVQTGAPVLLLQQEVFFSLKKKCKCNRLFVQTHKKVIGLVISERFRANKQTKEKVKALI